LTHQQVSFCEPWMVSCAFCTVFHGFRGHSLNYSKPQSWN
jgi:hypothetical protein